MWAVTTGGPGLVAVGFDGLLHSHLFATGGVPEVAAVWTSVDGIAWSRIPHDDSVFGGDGGQGMSAVVAGGPGLVAVGYDGIDAAVWTSVDGIAWSRVPHEAVFGGVVRMVGVVAGGPGLVAVGADGWHGRWDAAVWTSVDGIAWSRIPHDDSVFGGDGGQGMSAVVAGGPGLVAVGYDGDDAAVWTSVDGIAWSRVPHDEAVLGGLYEQKMADVVVGGPGLVAVGTAGRQGYWDPAVWTSTDGITWVRVAIEAVSQYPHCHRQGMVAVSVGGPGLVAVGYDGLISDQAAAVWSSPDGVAWTQVFDAGIGDLSGMGMSDVAAGGPGMVVVGHDMSRGDIWGSAAVWTRSPTG